MFGFFVANVLYNNHDYNICIELINESIQFFDRNGLIDSERENIEKLKVFYEISVEGLMKEGGVDSNVSKNE